ncbi:MAG TPA: arginine--tRNA ligase [Porticoccaceae bacterium]|jgi:arginyl-tRNA synthetase|nr:arginine--tRNA ligase [Gammaproteobacteria bacterium]HIL59323.1 arginine--tRNA ligase [Porticoccaceae bacterium]
MDTLKEHLSNLVSTSLSSVSGESKCNANVVTTSKPEFGDYQANGGMAIAKKLGSNPREFAQLVVNDLANKSDPIIAKMEVAGPGFINIHLAAIALRDRANSVISNTGDLIPTIPNPQRVVVDYSSPNLAKEMHVGHLRGTIIGDCLVRVLERLGHEIIRQNHVGDWGTQFGMLIAYMNELRAEQGDLPTQLADLETFYRSAKERFDSDPVFAENSRASVVKLQSGDPEYLEVWKTFIDESLQHCHTVYEKLGVSLSRENLKAESFYNSELENIVKVLEEKSLLSISDGAKCVFLPQFTGKDGELLPVIVQKSDGGFLYATTDLAAIKYRSFELDVARSLYVVDARQSLHFQQVFAVAKKAKLADEDISLEHITYGTMMGSDGKPFRTRSGDTIKLIDLLDESSKRAFELVTDKNPDLEEASRKLIADEIGIASVKYSELSKNRTNDYIFDWATMLSFEGNTAPYLMYAYARIKSILRKHNLEIGSQKIATSETTEERTLILKVLQLPEIVAVVAKDCYPNLLCNYLYELAGAFMRFYEACPILKAEDELRSSRLALAALTAEALQQGLNLLGIEPLEQM